MSLADVFGREDRTEVKFSEFFALVKQAAQYETVMNAVNCDVPHRFIRETMTGKKEEGPDIPEKIEAVLGVVKVDFDAAEPVVDALTPVPRGLGTVTTSVTMAHTVAAAEAALAAREGGR